MDCLSQDSDKLDSDSDGIFKLLAIGHLLPDKISGFLKVEYLKQNWEDDRVVYKHLDCENFYYLRFYFPKSFTYAV